MDTDPAPDHSEPTTSSTAPYSQHIPPQNNNISVFESQPPSPATVLDTNRPETAGLGSQSENLYSFSKAPQLPSISLGSKKDVPSLAPRPSTDASIVRNSTNPSFLDKYQNASRSSNDSTTHNILLSDTDLRTRNDARPRNVPDIDQDDIITPNFVQSHGEFKVGYSGNSSLHSLRGSSPSFQSYESMYSYTISSYSESVDSQDYESPLSSARNSLENDEELSINLSSPEKKSPPAAPPRVYEIEEMDLLQEIFIIISLCLGVFVATFGNTVLSTSLRNVIDEFQSTDLSTWFSTSYLLSATILRPIYGKIINVFGTRPMVVLSILVFQVGSIVCATAMSSPALIVGRSIMGSGAAGIMVLCNMMISRIVPMRNRSKYFGLLGAVFCISSALGPILGGAFSNSYSWRWSFYINLPLTVIPLISLLLLINHKPIEGSLRQKFGRLDYFGLPLLIASLFMFLLALYKSEARGGYKTLQVTLLLVFGSLLIPTFVIYELKFAKEHMIPMKIFAIRNIALSLLSQLFLGFVLLGVIFHMPTYYIIAHGGTSIQAGVFVLPFYVTLFISSFISGFTISKTSSYRPFIWAGTAVVTVGVGLISTFNENTSQFREGLYLSITGFGFGLCLQPMLISVQSSSERSVLLMSTTLVTFFRDIGGSIGVATLTAISNSYLSSRINSISQMYPQFPCIDSLSLSSSTIMCNPSITDSARELILKAYFDSVRKPFIALVPVALAAFVPTLFITHVDIQDFNLH
ncbi:putative HC-toxin efflux carrier TOXA [Smittium mucronatum]|uniref:Putative HC-toxin efflux carrier TOXA n=1 Tax=Smittium mucronatum TaxID=133383 RepID=A0A1R0GNT0_9FUNG|nr:putative HC-toxin efflux carrier TOXA [Smittium mucronatum]